MITYGERTLDLGVVAIRTVSEGVRSIDLARIDGADLPSWAPGAHIDLYLGNGLIRQ